MTALVVSLGPRIGAASHLSLSVLRIVLSICLNGLRYDQHAS